MILVGQVERKRQLGRPRCRLKDNIKIDFQEVGWEGMDWIHLEDRWREFVKEVMNLWDP